MKNFPGHCETEEENLRLLTEVQQILATALDSLGNKSAISKESAYVGWAAVAINRSAEGFLHLRSSGRVAASKMLVRPAVEAIYLSKAVLKKQGFLFRQAYTEWKKEKKLFAISPEKQAAADQALADLKSNFLSGDPNYPIQETTVRISDAAEAAGLMNDYHTTYALYCKFSHGALSAITGDLDDVTDHIDTKIVTWCVLESLELLRDNTPAAVPDLLPLKGRLMKSDAANG